MEDEVGAFSPARLVGARRVRRITQKALGDAVGRTPHTVRGYESGDRVPPRDIESALCDALGLDPDGLRAQHDDDISDYYAAARLAAGDEYDAASVTVLLPGRARAVRRARLASDGPDAEVVRLRAEIARLRADPDHVRDIENAPPLSDAARSIIAMAFGMTHDHPVSGGDAA